MAKIQGFRRIIKEDFDSKEQGLIDKLAFPINIMFESLVSALNKRLTFQDNINSQIVDVFVTVDVTGTPSKTTAFKSDVTGQVQGLWVVRADNLDNPGTYPTSAPFISYSSNGTQVIVNNITGLQAGERYKLRILAFA